MRSAGRRRARRTGVAALALLCATTVTALILARHYHLDVAATLVAILGGLPTLYLTWAAYRVAQRDAGKEGPGLTEIADGLADRLRSQWEREAAARGLNDPYPLPVSWTAADAPLAGDLDALRILATGGFGWSASGQEGWASRPEELAGGGKLADILAKVPTGRLVVLGEPGAGKTMLTVGLVLDLLHPDRRAGGPIPVLASLASWDPFSQDLHGWLGATLITDYPDLAAAAPPGCAGGNRFAALVEARRILPVLDGLDEMSGSARLEAITRINRELTPGEQVVMTCRTEQYRAAVSSQDGQGAVLRAAAVQLSTPEFAEVTRYLRKDAGPAAEGRWNFLDTLTAESPPRQALATPLMAGLARAIYNPRPGEYAGKLRDPAELCDFANRSAVAAHLFDAFVPAAYRHDPDGRWKAQDTAGSCVQPRQRVHTVTLGGPHERRRPE
jgi:NACHT domain